MKYVVKFEWEIEAFDDIQAREKVKLMLKDQSIMPNKFKCMKHGNSENVMLRGKNSEDTNQPKLFEVND